MIEIKNLSLNYGEKEILSDINICIKEPGLFLLCGESGSGKTSLLNIISLMDSSFKGEYYFDNKDVSLMDENTKSQTRFNNITYLFQIPKLIENESLKVNLEISLGRKLDNNETKELLNRVHLKNINKKVSSLSGGEKQRVNILMGILRDTPVILGDEITSGLDETSKKIILSLLKEESKRRIIILVSHDVETYQKYIKTIRIIENKTIEVINAKRNRIMFEEKKRNNELPFAYSIRHVFSIIASKKIRSVVSIFSSCIALVCLGLCLLLTTSLKDSIMNGLGSIIDENQIIMEKKSESYLIDEAHSIDKTDAKRILSRYNKFSYMGAYYHFSEEDFFQDENYITYKSNEREFPLSNLSIQDMVDYEIITPSDKELFYLTKDEIQEDEIVLSFTHGEISRICSSLNIEYKNDASLFTYLLESPLEIKMYLKNESWGYELESNFYLVGYTIDDERKVYHSDNLWNEYIVEEVLQFRSSLALNEKDDYPWTVKKEFYFYVEENSMNKLLDSILKDKYMNDYTFKITKEKYGYFFYFEYAHNSYLHVTDLEVIEHENSFLSGYLSCNDNGYTVIESALIAGFSMPTFLSKDYELLEEYINMNSYSEENLGAYQVSQFSYSNKDIFSLSILDATKDNFVRLKVDNNDAIYQNPNEISISKSLAKKMNIDESLINNKVQFMMLKDIEYANGKYKNNFIIVEAKIVSIIDSNTDEIYVPKLWPISFMMTSLGTRNIGVDKVVFSYSGNSINQDISYLNEKYQDYVFSNPYLDYIESIEEVKNYLIIGLTIFSSFCLISTLLMLIVSSNLFISETKKEIGIYNLYGYDKKSILRLFKVFSYILSIYSFFVSSISMVAIFIVLNRGNFVISFSSPSVLFLPIFVMFIVSFIIGFISSYASTYRVFRMNSLRQIYER